MPVPINFEEMGITAQIMNHEFLKEIKEEGLAVRVTRFVDEFVTPDDHWKRVHKKCGDNIPDDVRSVAIALGEHIQEIAPYMNPNLESSLAPVFVAAKMAAATAEIRAINHALGL